MVDCSAHMWWLLEVVALIVTCMLPNNAMQTVTRRVGFLAGALGVVGSCVDCRPNRLNCPGVARRSAAAAVTFFLCASGVARIGASAALVSDLVLERQNECAPTSCWYSLVTSSSLCGGCDIYHCYRDYSSCAPAEGDDAAGCVLLGDQQLHGSFNAWAAERDRGALRLGFMEEGKCRSYWRPPSWVVALVVALVLLHAFLLPIELQRSGAELKVRCQPYSVATRARKLIKNRSNSFVRWSFSCGRCGGLFEIMVREEQRKQNGYRNLIVDLENIFKMQGATVTHAKAEALVDEHAEVSKIMKDKKLENIRKCFRVRYSR